MESSEHRLCVVIPHNKVSCRDEGLVDVKIPVYPPDAPQRAPITPRTS
jgi:hypothetical protein